MSKTKKNPLRRRLAKYGSHSKAPNYRNVHTSQLAMHAQAISDTRKADLRRWLDDYIEAQWGAHLFPLLKEAQHDRLDNTAIQARIASIMPFIVVEDGLCKTCVSLLEHVSSSRNQDTLFDIGSTYYIEAAERKGCKCCSFFMKELRRENRLRFVRAVEWRHEACGVDVTSKVKARLGNPWPTLELFYPGKQINMQDDHGRPSHGTAFVARLVKRNTEPQYMESHSDLVLHWLKKCIEQHPECCTQSSYMPTRLLHISDHPKLVLTADMDAVPYATLSYCWGTRPATYCLTTQNIESKLQRVDNLPRTCADAIEIARHAGLNHIWIDALCIIQDDTADWQRESLQMQNVYGNSFLNIAASSATHADAGCHSRPTSYCIGFVAHGVQLQPYDAHDILTVQTALADRAWTLQERLLPARTVSCGDHGLVWECRTFFASQDLQDGIPTNDGVPRLLRVSSKPWDWQKLVQLYSGAELTYGSDKLLAIAGLAKQQYKLTQDEYLAGLWREDFLHQLCWQIEVPQERPPWRAPSWSWAAVDGPCAWAGRLPEAQYGHHKEVRYVHVASVTLDADDQFGQLRGGQLQLAVENIIQGRLGARAAYCDEVKIGTQAIEVRMDCLKDPYVSLSRNVCCVPICEQSLWRSEFEEDEAENIWTAVEGLVLQQHGEVYRRVGIFSFSEDEEDYKTLRKLMHDAAEKRQENDSRSVITII